MATVEIYTARMCPFCTRAINLLRRKGVNFQQVDVTFSPKKRKALAERAGATSVPQIWINDQHVGGSDDLYALEAAGELDNLLAQDAW
ncbi:MAG: glutaredoxin 3 [Rhodospirillaceae bacterium]|nr:glutaredoxin 3 [Rhodospirillaceae bacterium]